MRLLILGLCLALLTPAATQADENEKPAKGADERIQAATSLCDAVALGRSGDQIYISASVWLDCMTGELRCEHDPAPARLDIRDSIIDCRRSPIPLDYNEQIDRFWLTQKALQTQCERDLGGPCGFSGRLLTDEEIAGISTSGRSAPDPLPE